MQFSVAAIEGPSDETAFLFNDITGTWTFQIKQLRQLSRAWKNSRSLRVELSIQPISKRWRRSLALITAESLSGCEAFCSNHRTATQPWIRAKADCLVCVLVCMCYYIRTTACIRRRKRLCSYNDHHFIK